MEDTLISILGSMGYESYRQGSFTDGDDYPEHFFTFWNNSSEESGYYDNTATKEVQDFDVNFYSVDPEITYSVLREAKRKLKEKGFIIYDSGHTQEEVSESYTWRIKQ